MIFFFYKKNKSFASIVQWKELLNLAGIDLFQIWVLLKIWIKLFLMVQYYPEILNSTHSITKYLIKLSNIYFFLKFSISFYNWNRILINYCDGAIHQGFRKDPIKYLGKDIYFRGENNTKSMIQNILSLGMDKSSDVILAGMR